MKVLNKKNKLTILAKQMQTASEPVRLQILCFIFSKKRACVSDIAKKIKQSIAVTSHHLQALSKDQLLYSEREGKKICYFLSKNNFVNDLKNLICKYK